jgi:hypothetical protein
MVVHEAGMLDGADYAKAVYGLAARKHSHVTLTAPVLIQILLQDDSKDLEKLRIAAAFIGNNTADFQSHFKVAWDFLTRVWTVGLPDIRRAQAASIMLDRLVGMLARFEVLKETYLRMISFSRQQPLLKNYLVSWAKGHFLDI